MNDPLARFAERALIAQQAPGSHIGVAPPPVPAPNRFEVKMAQATSEEGQYMQYAEIARIVNLPLVFQLDKGETEQYNRMNLLADAYNEGFRLWGVQCDATYGYETCGGLLAPIGVGFGKTLTCLMIANKGFARGRDKIVQFVPSHVLYQLTAHDIKWARSKIPFNVPVHIVAGKDIRTRRQIAQSGKKGLYIMTYSLLSSKDAEELLYTINPSLIIGDECHNVKNKHNARTGRLLRFIDDNSPQQCFLSGTITAKSLNDYHHLIRGALGKNSPVPHPVALANEWAAIIDAEADSEAEFAKAGALLPVVSWAQRNFPREQIPENVGGFRRAFRLRLNSAPGVVSSGDMEIKTSLTFCNTPVSQPELYPGWAVLQDHLRRVDSEWVSPSGDIIEHAIHKWKWIYELTAGFFNQLTWPVPEMYARRKNISIPEAKDIVDRAIVHYQAGQAYASVLRRWLLDKSKKGLDTPFLVEGNMARNGDRDVGDELYAAWYTKKQLDFVGRPDRDATAVRVCDYKIMAAVRWCLEPERRDKGALLWVHHQEMGNWVYQALVDAGVPALHCPAGESANRAIADANNANKKIVASITAHGEGKNLQHFSEQLFVQWPRPAKTAEQCVGRTHRSGQQADELLVYSLNTTEYDDLNFAACLNDALYIHQTMGPRQKLIYAGYDPFPKIFPTAVLFERGLDTFRLDEKQQAALAEKFSQ